MKVGNGVRAGAIGLALLGILASPAIARQSAANSVYLTLVAEFGPARSALPTANASPTASAWPTSIGPEPAAGTPTPTQLPVNATQTAEALPTSIDPTPVIGTPTPTQLPVNATQTAEAWPTPIE